MDAPAEVIVAVFSYGRMPFLRTRAITSKPLTKVMAGDAMLVPLAASSISGTQQAPVCPLGDGLTPLKVDPLRPE
jgi:hypothetical protein